MFAELFGLSESNLSEEEVLGARRRLELSRIRIFGRFLGLGVGQVQGFAGAVSEVDSFAENSVFL